MKAPANTPTPQPRRTSRAAAVLMALVRGYQLLISPALGSACRFAPTCSHYSMQALAQHGALKGSYLTLYRLGRCQPWCAGGHDPVPEQVKAPAFFTVLITRKSSSS